MPTKAPCPRPATSRCGPCKLGLKPIVIINKVDRPKADPHGALDKTFDLFIELGADDDQLDFPVLYGSALEGWLVRDLERDERKGMGALFETIAHRVPPPQVDMDAPFRMQVCSLAWSDYIGRIGCGRVLEGTHRLGESLLRTSTKWHDHRKAGWDVTGSETARSQHLWVQRGLERRGGRGDLSWRYRLDQRPGRYHDR